ncbi:hypothetical protein OIU77_006760 [Salix suchowensis]|uniref:Peptidase A1 domain-containing protein n=1 Tax=Salix suchowensis TaxID=1278906 RepID=A0ABQ9ALU2_9ROSI|nr:hypothetical protein OIU77_006760 [Salix suchowensis]
MANMSCLSLVVVALAMFALVSSPAVSTSRRVLEHPKVQNGFRVKLKHVDSGKNLTKFERIQHGVKRGRHRLQRFKAMALVASSSSEIDAPVLPGNGEFLMKLAIGTPPETYSAILDTGSDLIWTQCKPCTQCFDQPTPIFDPKKSSSFSKLSCSSKLCEALPQSTCSDGCEYLYGYGDYSSTQGIMASETLTFGKVSVPNVALGCGEDNEGSGFSQGSGLVGLGRGPLSLVSQLKEPKFSYCLTSVDDTKSSTLLMGSLASSVKDSASEIKTTPLIQNSAQPSFYYLSLEGISVGETSLPIKKSTFSLQDDGSGGLIIDSGTTITYLEQSAFDLVAKRVHLSDKSPRRQLRLHRDWKFASHCHQGSTNIEVPKLVFPLSRSRLGIAGGKLYDCRCKHGISLLGHGELERHVYLRQYSATEHVSAP